MQRELSQIERRRLEAEGLQYREVQRARQMSQAGRRYLRKAAPPKGRGALENSALISRARFAESCFIISRCCRTEAESIGSTIDSLTALAAAGRAQFSELTRHELKLDDQRRSIVRYEIECAEELETDELEDVRAGKTTEQREPVNGGQ